MKIEKKNKMIIIDDYDIIIIIILNNNDKGKTLYQIFFVEEICKGDFVKKFLIWTLNFK